jgi:hypothetical protein
MHPSVVNREGRMPYNSDKATGMVIMRVGAEGSPEFRVASAAQEINHDFSIGARPAVNKNAARDTRPPLGYDNAVRISQREHIHFNSVVHQKPPQKTVTVRPHDARADPLSRAEVAEEKPVHRNELAETG